MFNRRYSNMQKLTVPPDAVPYVNALRDLIRTGATAAPSLQSSVLLELPVVLEMSGTSASVHRRSHVFLELLQHITNKRLTGADTASANILFAFGEHAGLPAQDRYREVAKLYHPHWTWENYRKDPLTRLLLAVYYALCREAEVVRDGTMAQRPRPAQNGLLGQDWALERFEGVWNLPAKPGDPVTIWQTRTIRCLAEEASVLRYRMRWWARGTDNVPVITLQGKGEVKTVDTYVIEDTDIHILISDIIFPRTLGYGETIDFTLLKTVPVNFKHYKVHSHDWYGNHHSGTPAKYIKVGVTIPPALAPQAIWKHENISDGFTHYGTPTPETLLTPDSKGYVEAEWQQPAAGHSYGVVVRW